MKRFVLIAVALAACISIGIYVFEGRAVTHVPAQNPDPNHLHADFAIWANGEKLDFTTPQYMTSEEQEDALPTSSPRKYLHLHDGNGHVLHIHKPGMTTDDFLASLDLALGSEKQGEECLYVLSPDHPFAGCVSGAMRMFVNGKEVQASSDTGHASYVMKDLDKLLLTDAATDAEVQAKLSKVTDDACRYSKTCPWRGTPLTEKCISDPSVPCSL